MLILPTILSFIAWLLCTAFTKHLVHCDSTAQLFSLIPAVWLFWFILDFLYAQEYKFLFPPVYKYNLSKKETFKRLTDYLAEATIAQGRGWRQRTLIPDEGRLSYDLAWTKNHSTYDIDERFNFREYKEKVCLWIALNIYVETLDTGSTIVQLDFAYDAEKLPRECHNQIIITTQEIEHCLGPGLPVPNLVTRTPLSTEIPAYISAIVTLLLAINIATSVFPSKATKLKEVEKHLAQTKNAYQKTRDIYLHYIDAYEQYKHGNIHDHDFSTNCLGYSLPQLNGEMK